MVPAVSDWKHKDVWVKRGKDFSVEVSRHEVGYVDEFRRMGPHRWCVYVYIYPEHPFFPRFGLAEDEKYQPNAVGYLPLHGGCTFYQAHRDRDGKITSYQVGADYAHLHDEWYMECATKEDAGAVFADAEDLRTYMEKGVLA